MTTTFQQAGLDPAKVMKEIPSNYLESSNIFSYTIPRGTTSIGRKAFGRCMNLKSIVIPSSVTKIGEHAFTYCDDLEAVHLADIGAWCSVDFYNSSSIPFKEKAKLYLNNELVTDLVIPSTVAVINSGAFEGLRHIKSLTIPDSVTTIGEDAFAYCFNLEKVILGRGITSIGGVFYHCNKLATVEIPSSVTSIGDYAFFHCIGLSSVTVPESVTGIGQGAFASCESLTKIEFRGTKLQWSAISKSADWRNQYTGNFTIYCIDGEISAEDA